MRDCLKTFTTPASVSLFIGVLSASILFMAGHTEGSSTTTTEAASQYLSTLTNFTKDNVDGALFTAGTMTTALFYTFVAKPTETMFKKCWPTGTHTGRAENTARYVQV